MPTIISQARVAKFCMQVCNIVLALRWQTTPPPLMGVVRVTWPVFLNFAPIKSLELVKLGTSNLVFWLTHRSTGAHMIYYRQTECVQSHRLMCVNGCKTVFVTGPPNGPVLFCSLASVVVVCNAAGGRAGRPPGAWAADTPRRASTLTSR